MMITKVYLNSETDSGPLNQYILQNNDANFYRFFIQKCYETLNDSDSSFKVRKRSISYLTKFKLSEKQTLSILSELGLKTFELGLCGNFNELNLDNNQLTSIEQLKSISLINSLSLLSNPLYLTNHNEVAVSAHENRLIYECELKGILWNKNNMISSLELLVSDNKSGKLIRHNGLY